MDSDHEVAYLATVELVQRGKKAWRTPVSVGVAPPVALRAME